MAVARPSEMARTLTLLAEKGEVLAPWNHAAFILHQDRGHVSSRCIFQINGRLGKSMLWTITEAGRRWREGG